MDKIKIAIDSCMVIMLAKLVNENMDEKDKAVIDCLKRKALTPSLYEGIDPKLLPGLLRDTYFGKITEGKDGKKYYDNLTRMYSLFDMIKKDRCEVYITPTVAGELDFEWAKQELNFINKYVKVIQVKDEDAKVFYSKRGLLAREYVKVGAMSELYNASLRKKVPENDAFIMAEASLCGLIFVTINEIDFINGSKKKDDYKRVLAIEEVNKKAGLVFESNVKNYKLEPQSMTLKSFILKSKYRKDGFVKPYWIVNPNINEEDYTYKNPLSK